MEILTTIILTVVLIIAISIATGYLTEAAADLKVGSDTYQQKAHKILVGASTFGWISIVLVIGAGIGLIYYGGSKFLFSDKGETATLIIFGFVGLLFLINGLLAMFAAINIKKGVNFNENQGPYTTCAWIAGIFLGGMGVILIYEIYKWSTKSKAKKEKEQTQAVQTELQTLAITKAIESATKK
jgi:hypothetical protein